VFWDLSNGAPPLDLVASEWHRYVQRIGHGLHMVDPEFRRFCTAPHLARVLEEGIEAPVKIVLSVVIYKQPEQKVGYYPWHQDSIYIITEPESLLTPMIALDDMTKENGCLQVAPGSHRAGLAPHPQSRTHVTIEDTSSTYEHRTFRDDEIATLEIEQGDVIFLPGLTWHTSGINRTKKPRRALLIDSISGKSRLMPGTWIHEPADGFMPMRAPLRRSRSSRSSAPRASRSAR
jgi:phytanoyl-CoA hydroxylase